MIQFIKEYCVNMARVICHLSNHFDFSKPTPLLFTREEPHSVVLNIIHYGHYELNPRYGNSPKVMQLEGVFLCTL